MANTFVKDIMKKGVITIDSKMTIKDAACVMDDTNVGCIIITKANIPSGILTERDFVKRVVSKNKTPSTPIFEVMSSPLVMIKPDETIWEAAEMMKQKRIHKLPVCSDNKVIGIVTTTDIVKICSIGSDSSMRNICDQILLRIKDTPSTR